MKSHSRRLFSACCVLVVSWAPPVHAYIDPGTGSALIQGVIATVAAVGVAANLYWHRIKSFIGREKDKSAPDGDSDEQ